jgi:hypothetical protein
MIEAVEKSGNAESYVKSILDKGERLMGFGHRVYRAEDPRARTLRRTAKELNAPRYEVALALEKAALSELKQRQPDRVLETNVEFWAAIVLDFAQGPANYPDGKSADLFRIFNKTSEFIPNSMLKYAAAPQSTGYAPDPNPYPRAYNDDFIGGTKKRKPAKKSASSSKAKAKPAKKSASSSKSKAKPAKKSASSKAKAKKH